MYTVELFQRKRTSRIHTQRGVLEKLTHYYGEEMSPDQLSAAGKGSWFISVLTF